MNVNISEAKDIYIIIAVLNQSIIRSIFTEEDKRLIKVLHTTRTVATNSPNLKQVGYFV